MKTHTRGSVIVEDIKVGDIHYEFSYGLGIKSEVTSLPMRDEDGLWTWTSRNLITDMIINYAVREGYSHYAPKLYDYEAYSVKEWL